MNRPGAFALHRRHDPSRDRPLTKREREIARDLSIFSPRRVPTAFLRRCYIYACEERYDTQRQAGGHARTTWPPCERRACNLLARNREKIFDSWTFTRTHSGPSTEKRSSPPRLDLDRASPERDPYERDFSTTFSRSLSSSRGEERLLRSFTDPRTESPPFVAFRVPQTQGDLLG